MAHKSTWFFQHQIRDFSGRTNRIFWWIHPDVDCGSLYSNARRGCRSTAGLSAICRVLHLSGSLTLGQWFGEVGPTPGGDPGWKECELNAAGAELSQHQRHKHTVSGRTEGCKYRGEGRGGGRDVVCLVIWSWRQELWIRKCCDTPHEYATIFPWIAPEYTEHNGSWMLAYNNNDHICFEVRQSKDNNRRFWIDLLSA